MSLPQASAQRSVRSALIQDQRQKYQYVRRTSRYLPSTKIWSLQTMADDLSRCTLGLQRCRQAGAMADPLGWKTPPSLANVSSVSQQRFS